MRFEVLGPLRIWDEDRPLHLPQGRTSMVLSYLLLHANESIATLSIGRALWPGQPETQVRLHVRAAGRDLVKLLGTGMITSRASLGVGVDSESIDAHRFAQTVERAQLSLRDGDPAGARSGLHEALSLWRGEAFSDLAGVDEAIPEIERLSAIRVAALEELYGIELREAVSYPLVARLRADVVKMPQRPRLWRQLALALYLSGRQTEALAAVRESATAAGTTDPLMSALESAMLRHDPDLDGGEYPVLVPPSGPAR